MKFSPSNEILVSSKNDFGDTIAELIIKNAKDCIKKNNLFSVALPGGRMPISVFKSLVSYSRRNKLDWSKVHIFLLDERYVGLNHKDSNFKQCYENLLIHIDQINYYPIDTKKEISISAREYSKLINLKIKKSKNGIPSLDMILIGVGDDGHIASLFPNSKELRNNQSKIVIPVKNLPFKHQRITFSLELIKNAKKRIFGISGEKKLSIYNQIKNGVNNDYPLKYLTNESIDDIWVLTN